MQTVRQISLSGHTTMFRLNEEAYAVLDRYLERARLRLNADPDREEVLRDLEQAIGEKLAARLRSDEQIINVAEVNAVLAEVGPVDTGSDDPTPTQALPRGRRRLVRILEGQDLFGVCQGLAAYSNIDVDWVRSIFVLLALGTGGVFILVYVLMAFILPVVHTRAEYFAMQRAVPQTP